MSNNYAPCFNRIDFVVIPFYKRKLPELLMILRCFKKNATEEPVLHNSQKYLQYFKLLWNKYKE